MPNNLALALLPLVLALPCASQAQVYKWTDADGKVHYSERKPEGPGGAQPQTVKITKSPEAPPKAPPMQQQDGFLGYPPPGAGPAPAPAAREPQQQPPPRSQSRGREDGSDRSRCLLARDVLNGSLGYANGNPIDKYAIETAQNDVKAFCKDR